MRRTRKTKYRKLRRTYRKQRGGAKGGGWGVGRASRPRTAQTEIKKNKKPNTKNLKFCAFPLREKGTGVFAAMGLGCTDKLDETAKQTIKDNSKSIKDQVESVLKKEGVTFPDGKIPDHIQEGVAVGLMKPSLASYKLRCTPLAKALKPYRNGNQPSPVRTKLFSTKSSRTVSFTRGRVGGFLPKKVNPLNSTRRKNKV